MCISVSPAVLANTRIYAGEAQRDGKYVHVLSYQNEAKSYGPNAMILPIPAESLGPENVIDTTVFSDFLKDIATAAKFPQKALGARSVHLAYGCAATDSIQMFDSGSYTILISSNGVEGVAEAVASLPTDKRVGVSDELLSFFAAYYPNWPLMICAWKGNIKAEPLLVWYEPKENKKANLFVPAVDSHHGGAPERVDPVKVDHELVFGSTLKPISITGRPVKYSQNIPPNVLSLLPTKVVGDHFKGKYENGDFFFKTSQFTGDLVVTAAVSRRWPSIARPTEIKLGTWLE